MNILKKSLNKIQVHRITNGFINIRWQSSKADTTLNKDEKVARPASIAPHGTVLKGINFIKGKSDPVAKEDSEYPDWLWSLLDEKPKTTDIFDRQYQRKINKDNIKAKNFLKKR